MPRTRSARAREAEVEKENVACRKLPPGLDHFKEVTTPPISPLSAHSMDHSPGGSGQTTPLCSPTPPSKRPRRTRRKQAEEENDLTFPKTRRRPKAKEPPDSKVSASQPTVSTPVHSDHRFEEVAPPSPVSPLSLLSMNHSPGASDRTTPLSVLSSPPPPRRKGRTRKTRAERLQTPTHSNKPLDNAFGELDDPLVVTGFEHMNSPKKWRSVSPMAQEGKKYDLAFPPSLRRQRQANKKPADSKHQAAFKEWADKMNAEFAKIEKIPLNIITVKKDEPTL